MCVCACACMCVCALLPYPWLHSRLILVWICGYEILPFDADKVGIFLMIYGFLCVRSDERLAQLQVIFFSPTFLETAFVVVKQTRGSTTTELCASIIIRSSKIWESFQGVWLTWLAGAGWTPAGYLSVLSRYCSFIKTLSALPHLSSSRALVGLVYLFIFSLQKLLIKNASYWSGMRLRTAQTLNRQGWPLLSTLLFFSLSLFYTTLPFHLLLSLVLVHSGPDPLVMHRWLFLGWAARGHLSCHKRPNLQMAGLKSQGARQK